MRNVESLENYKFIILNHFLEINEYKKENKYIPVESYEQLLETYLMLLNTFIDLEQWDFEFKKRLRKSSVVKFD